MKEHPNCFLCRYSLPEWQALIGKESQLQMYRKGESIFRSGEESKGFYFIHEGSVKIHKKWKNNRDLILKFAGPGDVLGHRGMLDTKHPVSATAINPVSVCFISAAFFKTTLLVNHELAYQMVLFFAEELHQVEASMRNMIYMSVPSRIAHALKHLHQRFGVDQEGYLSAPLSRQDMASFAGTTYESLFKALNDWKAKGIVELTEKKLAIRNLDQLQMYIADELP